MSYYVIIRGPLGVGKSTIARKSAEILKATYVSIISATAVHNLVSRFDYGITIDTDDKTEGQVVEEILVHLPARSTL